MFIRRIQSIVIAYSIFSGAIATYCQKVDLTGTVYSFYGNPVKGLIVSLNNATMTDTSDANGKFSFKRESNTSVSNNKKGITASVSKISSVLYFGQNNQESFVSISPSGSPIQIYNLSGKCISGSTVKQHEMNLIPGIYFVKGAIDPLKHSTITAQKNSSVDNLSISFKDSLRQTVAIQSYVDTLDIQLTEKMFDQWPQVHAGDSMPPNPGLKVGSYVTGVTTSIHNNGYVAMLIGDNRPSCITDEIAKRDLAQLDVGLREVVEIVGFPAFPEWKNGNFLNWVILNSGIPNATLPDEGGHQGNRWGHMNFESTKTCPCTWDTYQSGGALHECVHALIAERWVYNNDASGWIHEGFNNYLTTMANALVRKKYTMGWTASLHLNMPHIPVESMGMATDDYIAGPADQGMNGKKYISDQHRYGGEIFFLSLSQVMGRGFNVSLFTTPAKNSSKSILQIFHSIYGDEAYAAAIMSYAAKSAILDFEEWTTTMRELMRSNWNNNYWFYMFPGGDGTTTFSPPVKTTPHHQGRNIIPIKLASGASSVTVEFNHDAKGSKGTTEKMQAQLVYRDKTDKPVYGPVFSSGQNMINIPNGTRNDIVNLVVAVIHPNATSGSDDGSNKGFDAQEHFSYKARIVSGGTIAPTTIRPW